MKNYWTVFIISILSLNTALGQYDDKSFSKADKEINLVYKKILAEYSSDKEFIKNFKTSQRLWIQFRDAEVKAKFPDRSPGYYGSVHSMCISNLMTELTNERIKTLKVWLTGIEEGDVCSGSVKRKP